MLVSVIIPCYNVQEYIIECVESVLNQTHQHIEIICIDNNSTDETWSILLELNKKHPQIIIDKELKAGAPSASNKGLTLAKGEWIQFLDADDLLLSTKIEHQLQLVKSSLNVNDFVAASFVRRDLKGKDTVTQVSLIDGLINCYNLAFINQLGITSSNFWKKTALAEVGNWNENIKSSQESELMMRLTLNGNKFINDPEPLTIIRERVSGQISQRNPSEKWQQYIDVRLSFMNQFKLKFPHEYSKSQGMLYDFLMVSVITLSKYDKPKAIMYYQKYIKNEWHSAYTLGFSKLKVKLIKLFGIQILFLK